MRKKLIASVLVAILAVSSLVVTLSGCSKNVNDFAPVGEDFAENATLTYADGTAPSRGFLMTEKKSEIKVTFQSEVEINTLVFNEKTATVQSLEIWAPSGESSELIYKQDELGGIRYCYLDNIKVTELTVKASAYGKYCINRFEAYNIPREQNDFRVTTYLSVSEYLANPKPEGISHVTDIIFFGTGNYNELGDITYDLPVIESAIAAIKEIRGDNMPKIYVNFLMASDVKNTTEMKGEDFFEMLQRRAMLDNGAKLIANFKQFAELAEVDGISFDYEFPYSLAAYKVYSDFLVQLKAAMPNKLLTIAVAPWGLHYSKAAIAAVDVFQVMAYDLMDKRGNHCGWENTCVSAIKYMTGRGFPTKKLNLGVGFYSRPVDYGAYWGSWASDYQKLSKFSNYVAEEFVSTDFSGKPFLVKGRWYNGVNMIKDKTAFAYDKGVGGMMIWHYNCDVEYDNERSLLRAMNSIFD